jgi:hypothetical protein
MPISDPRISPWTPWRGERVSGTERAGDALKSTSGISIGFLVRPWEPYWFTWSGGGRLPGHTCILTMQVEWFQRPSTKLGSRPDDGPESWAVAFHVVESPPQSSVSGRPRSLGMDLYQY